jgi:multiple sugar transport system ATP-binding protein
MSGIVLKNLKKIYPGGVEAVKDFSLEIRDREFIVLVGPSGCGKSTVLRMIAGLEEITDGELYIDGNLVNHIAPKDRDLAMVFQNYALYPHMTIYKNLAFALSLRKLSSKEIDAKVRETAKMLDIDHLLDRKPKALSGGQRQRVALGRAMVREPKAFLLDEPLSNLDAKLRATTRTEIAKIHKKLGTTFIYVTHDQTEAMTMADRIVVMKDGQIQQIGEPKEIYDSPNNLFVAGFIGTPQMNFLEAMIEKDVDYYALIDDKRFVLSNERFGDILNEYRGKNVGIAEQNLIGTAAGLALAGKIPFASSFAMFAAGRAFEIIRNTVAYPGLNVKIAATHAGLSVGEDGGSHQAIEDISLMRSIPNMTVISPADGREAEQAVLRAAEYVGPVYIRLGRMAVEDVYDDSYVFELGKGVLLRDGKDAAIIATGLMVQEALKAHDMLKEEGIDARVINIHTIKPIDRDIIIKAAKETKAIVTAEEHSVVGGLGSAVLEAFLEPT